MIRTISLIAALTCFTISHLHSMNNAESKASSAQVAEQEIILHATVTDSCSSMPVKIKVSFDEDTIGSLIVKAKARLKETTQCDVDCQGKDRCIKAALQYAINGKKSLAIKKLNAKEVWDEKQTLKQALEKNKRSDFAFFTLVFSR